MCSFGVGGKGNSKQYSYVNNEESDISLYRNNIIDGFRVKLCCSADADRFVVIERHCSFCMCTVNHLVSAV